MFYIGDAYRETSQINQNLNFELAKQQQARPYINGDYTGWIEEAAKTIHGKYLSFYRQRDGFLDAKSVAFWKIIDWKHYMFTADVVFG